MATLDKWSSVVREAAKKRNISLSGSSESRIRDLFRSGDEKMIDRAVEELHERSGYKLSDEEKRDIRKEIERGVR